MAVVTEPYATPGEYRMVISMTDSDKDYDIGQDLTAVSRYLDGKLNRFFAMDAAPVSRIYLPECRCTEIWVNDMAAAPESVKIDTGRNGQFDTELAVGDYELLPYNADKGPEPWPFTQIKLTPWGSAHSFLAGERVQVTAKFGWPAIPAAIRRATIQLTAILRMESPRATRRIAELGETIEASQDAQSIIAKLVDQYKIWRV